MNRKRPQNKTCTSSNTPSRIDPRLYQEEILKAANRIGVTTDQTGSWIARFAGMNLTTLSTGQWADLQFEVACLAEYQYQAKDSSFLWQHSITKRNWDGSSRFKNCHEEEILNSLEGSQNPVDVPIEDLIGLIPSDLPPREEIEAIQKKLIAIFRDLEHGSVKFAFPPIGITIAVDRDTDDNIAIGLAEWPQDLLTSNIIFILATNAVRIRRCAECQMWFFADRKNKSYCSLRCQSRAGTRRWRGTPPDKLGKRGRPIKKKVIRNSTERRKRHG